MPGRIKGGAKDLGGNVVVYEEENGVLVASQRHGKTRVHPFCCNVLVRDRQELSQTVKRKAEER